MKGVNKVSMVEFRSHIGNTIVYPCFWAVEDNGNVFGLKSPDGHAVINVFTFTVAGSGSFEEFRDLMLSLAPGDWEESPWVDVDFVDTTASKRHLLSPDEDAAFSWEGSSYRLYAQQNGECYHAILLEARPIVMQLNGDFFEEFIRSFRGIAAVRGPRPASNAEGE
ncbi:MAG TPA: hypothetical protein VML55_19650 [Planctomycetaceae bacterium]|nr:hypothetical protein [Planctomycetaceae bacterium]